MSQPDGTNRPQHDAAPRMIRCDEHPPALGHRDAAELLTQHTGHGSECVPYVVALARLSTMLP